jgi:hypothetical protein
MERGADFLDVGAVGTDGFVELITGNAELFRPVRDVRSYLGVDLLGVMRALGMNFLNGVRFVRFRDIVVLGHISSFRLNYLDEEGRGEDVPPDDMAHILNDSQHSLKIP